MSETFMAQFGFISSPFSSTNAEREPLLHKYFVPPPYFSSILGNPDFPHSQIVFAPRGSGKTAQRRTLEDEASIDRCLSPFAWCNG